MAHPRTRPASIIVREYGRGAFLGLIQPVLAWFMASAGMRGWEQSARSQMERDAADMVRRGYRVVAADEYRLAAFGLTWFRVTYAPDRAPDDRPDGPDRGPDDQHERGPGDRPDGSDGPERGTDGGADEASDGTVR